MNTLVLLVAASCTPAADPLPVMETQPYKVPSSISAASQEWSGAPQESRPRFFARLRGLFSRRSHPAEGSSPDLASYPSTGLGNSAVISPAPMASPGISTNNADPSIFRSQPVFAPSSSPTLQRMPTGQPF